MLNLNQKIKREAIAEGLQEATVIGVNYAEGQDRYGNQKTFVNILTKEFGKLLMTYTENEAGQNAWTKTWNAVAEQLGLAEISPVEFQELVIDGPVNMTIRGVKNIVSGEVYINPQFAYYKKAVDEEAELEL